MTYDEAIKLLSDTLNNQLRESKAIWDVIKQIEGDGWFIDTFATTVHLALTPQSKPQTDADFLREMQIDPDITPKRRNRFP